ncbi:MAG TPA: S8 family serine peptidase, partial [Gammaproteobacteria bacterium]|nr:S8 family serine peptidase [Gammaproteobacteria bacterium]
MPIAPRAVAWLAAAFLTPAAAQVTHVQPTQPVQLLGPLQPVKGGSAVYIVKLRTPGAASYKRSPTDFSAAKPSELARSARSAAAEAYAKQVEQTHDRLLGSIGAASSKLYSYRYSVNGFAAKLTAAQVARLAQSPEVERIWQDTDRYLQTNNSANFLGLQDPMGGLRADLGLRGENIVVGIIDSGIAPQHPSLRDTEDRTPRACRSDWSRTSWLGIWLCTSYRRNPPTVVVYDPPVGFTGTCQAGDGFAATDCNNKVVGARFYLDGFLARHELDRGEF